LERFARVDVTSACKESTMKTLLAEVPDNRSRNAVRTALREAGARRVDELTGPLGLDFATTTLLLDGHPIVVDSDHCMGISIDGPEEVVAPLAERVRQLLK